MRYATLALAVASALVSTTTSVAPATQATGCPDDTSVELAQRLAGHRLYAAMHSSRGWVLMLYGTPSGDGWWVYAVNGRHESCLSSEGDHLEIVSR